MSKSNQSYVYFIQLQNEENLIKIGQSKTPLKRLKELRYFHKTDIKILLITKSRNYGNVTEKHIHKLFKQYRKAGSQDWFHYDNSILAYINKLKKYGLAENEKSIYANIINPFQNENEGVY